MWHLESQLLPPSKAKRSGILFYNVVLLEKKLHIFLQFNKTDPLGIGSWISLQECTDVNIYPVSASRAYIQLGQIFRVCYLFIITVFH